MGRMLWIVLVAGTLAGPASAFDMNSRLGLHCQDGSDPRLRDCTAANGRADAEKVLGRNKLALFSFGGPAMPQEPLEILREEYTQAGIEVWWTGDMPQFSREAYYGAFNQRMEEAFDARNGRGAIRKVHERIDARIKDARARAEGTAAGGRAR